jgi:deoxyribodipyrimidine photo-lyase
MRASESAPDFEPTREAALARLATFDPADYARTRNHLNGTVSRLSPYITHGVLTVPEVWREVQRRHGIDFTHRFAIELGWREYFHHAWRHDGDAIFTSLHAGPLPDDAYATALPEDVLTARTGVPVVDQAVQTLIQTGWLHNHARLWLASYIIHVRKIHWRVGADWMFGHLLDGDLASNHLSWQWVAGTGSSKPYLFNAENVARFAPHSWHSPGSVLDTNYEALDALARTAPRARPVREARQQPSAPRGVGLLSEPPFALRAADASQLEDAWLIHPWALAPAPAGRRAVGVFAASFHRQWPWSERRWRFVVDAMRRLTDRVVWCETPPPASIDTITDPHLKQWLAPGIGQLPPRLYADPGQRCRSFSAYWRRVVPVK